MAEPLVPRGELLFFAADCTGLRHRCRSELIQHRRERVLSTKLLSTKLTSARLTKRRACVVPLKHGANRDQSKTEGSP